MQYRSLMCAVGLMGLAAVAIAAPEPDTGLPVSTAAKRILVGQSLGLKGPLRLPASGTYDCCVRYFTVEDSAGKTVDFAHGQSRGLGTVTFFLPSGDTLVSEPADSLLNRPDFARGTPQGGFEWYRPTREEALALVYAIELAAEDYLGSGELAALYYASEVAKRNGAVPLAGKPTEERRYFNAWSFARSIRSGIEAALAVESVGTR